MAPAGDRVQPDWDAVIEALTAPRKRSRARLTRRQLWVEYRDEALVHGGNCHVRIDRNHYSAPERHIGRKIHARVGERMVELFLDKGGERIAVHRLKSGRNQYATDPGHMPDRLNAVRDIREAATSSGPMRSSGILPNEGKPPDPKAGAPVLDSTETARLSPDFERAGGVVQRLCGAGV